MSKVPYQANIRTQSGKKILRHLLALLLVMQVMPVSSAEIITGRVVAVHDGDTVTLATGWVSNKTKIRLAQIDAPESAQAFGQESRRSLYDMVYGKNVNVSVETLDKDGRTVGTIFLSSFDVNREQIRRGMAWAYRQYLHDQSLLQVEDQARRSRVGLWSDANPMPPWVFRHGGSGYAENHPAHPSAQAQTQRTGKNCGSKHTCQEMDSCQEANYYLTHCGLFRLDRDKDGVPCESICNQGR